MSAINGGDEMKCDLFLFLLLPLFVMAISNCSDHYSAPQSGQEDLGQREEIQRSFDLSPGARVFLVGISASVEIEPLDGDGAEVRIVRSARERAELACHTIDIEQKGNAIYLRQGRDAGCASHNAEVRNRVLLRVPRLVNLVSSAVSGMVKVGAIEGTVQVASHSGTFEMDVARSGLSNVDLSAVSGTLSLRFAKDANAKISINGISGDVLNKDPDISLRAWNAFNFTGQIGSGGTPIMVRQMSGKVVLQRIDDASGATTSEASRAAQAASVQSSREIAVPVVPGNSRAVSSRAGIDIAGSGYAEKEQSSQSFELSPGANVEIDGLSGSLQVEASDGPNAEITIIRMAQRQSDFAYRKVAVEHSQMKLVIKQERGPSEPPSVDMLNSVVLKVPANVNLSAKGVSGSANLFGLRGKLSLEGISGNVKASGLEGELDVKGVSGSADLSLSGSNKLGVKVSGVSGNVLFGLAQGVNTDMNLKGSVICEVPGLNLEHNGPSSYNLRVGTGGAPISVSGVTGLIKIRSEK
jgi:DUF4097 and DUF4098 domain-containing protein YvlB